jgi:hypothetical protein
VPPHIVLQSCVSNVVCRHPVRLLQLLLQLLLVAQLVLVPQLVLLRVQLVLVPQLVRVQLVLLKARQLPSRRTPSDGTSPGAIVNAWSSAAPLHGCGMVSLMYYGALDQLSCPTRLQSFSCSWAS